MQSSTKAAQSFLENVGHSTSHRLKFNSEKLTKILNKVSESGIWSSPKSYRFLSKA